MINHLALYSATHQDSQVAPLQMKVWFVRIVRKAAWKVIKMTAEKRPIAVRRVKKAKPQKVNSRGWVLSTVTESDLDQATR